VVGGGVERGLTGGDIFNPRALATDLLTGGAAPAPGGPLGNRGDAVSFYSAQDADDTARLMRGGEPWPGGATEGRLRDIFGPGLYTFPTREQAELYRENLMARGAPDLSLLEHRIAAQDLAGLRSADLTSMTDDEATAIIDQGAEHGYEHVRRRTGRYGIEDYFSADVFGLFDTRVVG
jgi:hypothetical protein